MLTIPGNIHPLQVGIEPCQNGFGAWLCTDYPSTTLGDQGMVKLGIPTGLESLGGDLSKCFCGLVGTKDPVVVVAGGGGGFCCCCCCLVWHFLFCQHANLDALCNTGNQHSCKDVCLHVALPSSGAFRTLWATAAKRFGSDSTPCHGLGGSRVRSC